jgi:hypothetical protein
VKKSNPEFERFDKMMGALLSVPHEKVKAELDAEKKEKKQKKKSKQKSLNNLQQRA